MKKRPIIVGARGSLLSVAQTRQVIRVLKKKFPGKTFVLKKITTLGDRSMKWSRSDRGIFVKEIEDGLISGLIDIGVHSMKDLPSEIPPGLTVAAVTKRQDPRDVLISKQGCSLDGLKKNAVIGTSSLRRASQLLRVRRDIRIKELRGNLDTRIKKLNDGLYDAIVVAAAGLKRLRIKDARARHIQADAFIPSCGQGALGLEIRKSDAESKKIAGAINHMDTMICVDAERAFLKETRAGCRMPVAAFARIKGVRIFLNGMISSLDGRRVISVSQDGPVKRARILGRDLARTALKKGGRKILKEIKDVQE